MELRVRVARIHPYGEGVGDERSDTEGWTESFADWITEDRRLGRSVVVRRVSVPPRGGAMSPGATDWISLAVDSGSFLTGLIGLFVAFRAALPRREEASARLVVECGGKRYLIDEETPEDAARVARALGLLPAPDEGTPGRATA
ncbi:effector-associated constant component EACC1 [Streptomyces dangxiongensis]|uniref:effector-associated constant component EACC1 n=1 Tax=Streptomyces dangxiongensis TaxID=1442032 RepID=UPI0013CEC201|nr:hypothetical protein [Streptomyces dangxiongensis]